MKNLLNEKICPVCGLGLEFFPWDTISPSDEICPCCGTQFGYHDAIRNEGILENTIARYNTLRKDWINDGMKWHFPNDTFNPEPPNWSPKEQLKNIEIEL